MRAIFKRELAAYLNNVSGYVFGAFLLLFVGIYTMVYNLQYAYAEFSYVLDGMSFVFLVIVPVLTMRVLAEERKQKTDQLLYSLPLSMWQVVLGKYLAMMVVFLIPVTIICLYPLILSSYGNLNMLGAYSAIAGFFFLGAALIAMGTYVSSVTESQAVAAGLCFVVMLVNYFIASLATFVPTTATASLTALVVAAAAVALVVRLMTKNTTAAFLTFAAAAGGSFLWYSIDSAAFEGLFPDILEKLSLYEQFYNLLNGVLDLRCIIYFLSVCGVFLFLSVQSMEKRRWSE